MKNCLVIDCESNCIVHKKLVNAEIEYPRLVNVKEIPEIPYEVRKILGDLNLTIDQLNYLKTLIQFLKSDRQYLVILGDRGRGKSTCLVLTALILTLVYKFPYISIIIPDEKIPKSMINTLTKILKDLEIDYKIVNNKIEFNDHIIDFVTPTKVNYLGFILIDEAARIGIARIRKIFSKTTKAILSTTIHGYEGTGKAFQLMLLRELENKSIITELKTPIRYGINDELENWLYKTFLLKTVEKNFEIVDYEDVNFIKLEQNYLIENYDKLREVFSILTNAHYRTEPDDLLTLIEAPHHEIYALTYKDNIVAVCQVTYENFNKVKIKDLISSRVKGLYILPKLVQYGSKEVSKLKCLRIVRIAVHTKFQRKGFGTILLKYVENLAKSKGIDLVGTIFSRFEVIDFWLKNNYIPVYLSPRFNRFTGEKNILFVKPLNEKSLKIIENTASDFKRRLLLLVSTVYRDVNPDIVAKLVQAIKFESKIKFGISSLQHRRIEYYLKYRGEIEYVQDVLQLKLIEYLLNNTNYIFNEVELSILIGKLLQGYTVNELSEILNIDRNRLRRLLRKSINKLIRVFTKT